MSGSGELTTERGWSHAPGDTWRCVGITGVVISGEGVLLEHGGWTPEMLFVTLQCPECPTSESQPAPDAHSAEIERPWPGALDPFPNRVSHGLVRGTRGNLCLSISSALAVLTGPLQVLVLSTEQRKEGDMLKWKQWLIVFSISNTICWVWPSSAWDAITSLICLRTHGLLPWR